MPTQPEIRYLTSDELARLRRYAEARGLQATQDGACGAVREWALLDTLLSSGLRAAEVAALCISDCPPRVRAGLPPRAPRKGRQGPRGVHLRRTSSDTSRRSLPGSGIAARMSRTRHPCSRASGGPSPGMACGGPSRGSWQPLGWIPDTRLTPADTVMRRICTGPAVTTWRSCRRNSDTRA